MSDDVLGLEEVDGAQVDLVGGKGASLGELMRVGGVQVPPGFCVTTGAFRRVAATTPALDEALLRLGRVHPQDREGIRSCSEGLRSAMATVTMPGDLAAAITAAVARFGGHDAYAVRSSATAEDLPGASFAGQHDTYLDVVGAEAVIGHVRQCWASLFSERAVAYRLHNGIDHRQVHMAVVVQRMVLPQASGVLFTADPVSGNRTIEAVEATPGLGEAMVSGLVNPELYKVRYGEIIERATAPEQVLVGPLPRGGTRRAAAGPAPQSQPALTDAQVLELARLGRRIEAHFGCPQDIEWCLVDGGVVIVQSRPVTALFPVPAAPDDAPRVYVSVGHQQMMTDPMRPLGISFWQLTGRPRRGA